MYSTMSSQVQSYLALSLVLLHLLIAHLNHPLQQPLRDGPALQLHQKGRLRVLFSKLSTHRQLLVRCVTECEKCKVNSLQVLAEGIWTQLNVFPTRVPGCSLVSEPDPSRGGGGKGLGTCLHASCPHGM